MANPSSSSNVWEQAVAAVVVPAVEISVSTSEEDSGDATPLAQSVVRAKRSRSTQQSPIQIASPGKASGKGKPVAVPAAVPADSQAEPPVAAKAAGKGKRVQTPAAKAKAEAKAAAKEAKRIADEEAEARDDDEPQDDPQYRIHCKAILLTYASDAVPLERFQDECLRLWPTVKNYSWCLEKGSQTHTHIYMEFKGASDHLLKEWALPKLGDDGLEQLDESGEILRMRPDCRPNGCRGPGFRKACDRGHFYVVCKYKSTHIEAKTNYAPNQGYIVNTRWIKDMWQQGKIRSQDASEASGYYCCGTAHVDYAVRGALAHRAIAVRKEWKDARLVELAASRQPYRVCSLWDTWRAQYTTVRDRYDFFWITGDSKMGKTQWVQSHFRRPFIHFGGVSWDKYCPVEYDCIIFDDVATTARGMDQQVVELKQVFQASERPADVNNSATNVHSKRIDVWGKPIIVCSNCDQVPYSAWVLANCYAVKFTQPSYGADEVATWWDDINPRA